MNQTFERMSVRESMTDILMMADAVRMHVGPYGRHIVDYRGPKALAEWRATGRSQDDAKAFARFMIERVTGQVNAPS